MRQSCCTASPCRLTGAVPLVINGAARTPSKAFHGCAAVGTLGGVTLDLSPFLSTFESTSGKLLASFACHWLWKRFRSQRMKTRSEGEAKLLKKASATALVLANTLLPKTSSAMTINLSDDTGLRISIRRVTKRTRKPRKRSSRAKHE